MRRRTALTNIRNGWQDFQRDWKANRIEAWNAAQILNAPRSAALLCTKFPDNPLPPQVECSNQTTKGLSKIIANISSCVISISQSLLVALRSVIWEQLKENQDPAVRGFHWVRAT
jgi:hypothetical protein